MLIDVTYERRAPLSGTGVYLRRLCQELRALAEVELVAVANPRRSPPAGGGLGSVRNLLGDLRWTAVWLPRLARRVNADVIHHPLPALAPVASVPQVVTVLDLAFERLPERFDPRFRRWARLTHRAAARSADAVICISATTAADARALWGLDPRQIVVAPLGPGQVQDAGARSGVTGDRPSPGHFLYVGDAEPRKNLDVLLHAYSLYRGATPAPLDLVLAGSATARDPGVRVERSPSEAQLRRLLAGAVALVHPSLYEGFGLTLLEAMALGAPVLAARVPGVAELCADAVRYADPHDPASFAAAMSEIGGDRALAQELSTRGLRRARDFSWAGCARAHVEAYSLALRT
ncbi:MAG: glycosyltransferase family 4 protein [Actinomycetota bacterium]|nr:glycosyltransferase family 4 protein [Actinomycetota bacterium]